MTTLRHKNAGGLTSVAIGAPVGLFSMYFGLLMPAALFGEGFILGIAAPLLLYPAVALVVSFLVILWFAGNSAANNFRKGQAILIVSFKYSATVNFVMWTVFYLVTLVMTKGEGAVIFFYLPAVFMLIGIVFAPFTIGLLICLMIRRKITDADPPTDILPEGDVQTISEDEVHNPQVVSKRHVYESDAGTLVIEQKLAIPSGDDVAFLNDKLAPSGKYKIGENQFVLVSNGYIYAVRGFGDKKT